MSKDHLTIAVDFDMTFTADPALFGSMIRLMRERGHTVLLVTCRKKTFENEREISLALKAQGIQIPILMTSHNLKSQYCTEQGYRVHIWIDDAPENISEVRS